ncbi:hypothetical protein RYX36_012096 [Vicia faba]
MDRASLLLHPHMYKRIWRMPVPLVKFRINHFLTLITTNNQTVTLYTFQFEAHFYYSSSLKFFVAANSVVCFLSVSLLLFNLLRRRQQTHQLKDHYFFLFLFDLVMTVLLIAGCAPATTVGFVGQYGEDHVGWTPICDNVKKLLQKL